MSILHLIIISATPIIEQRGAIPIGIINGVGIWETYIITLLGAMIPAPFILLLMPSILNLFKKIKYLDRLAIWYEERALKKSLKIKDNFKFIGIFLFVAIPLPGTGVWTGSTVAALLKLDFKKSLLAVLFGAATAGILVLIITYGVKNLF